MILIMESEFISSLDLGISVHICVFNKNSQF